ncbi:MAG: HYR domain-containing protein [Saprospiraceae bacterium]|nr:HYR domain-containing protein [Saprospiraceae bacterium]
MKTLLIALALLLAVTDSQAQFQRQYGTNLDETFTKVIRSGANYYVLGTGEITDGQAARATVSRLNATGQLQWTLSLNTASRWNDAVLTPNGNLLLVGQSMPDDNTSRAIMGLVTTTGTFSWVRSYDQPNRDAFTRIARNPSPQNAAYPYYVLGRQVQSLPNNDDVFLMNVDETGDINWKKKFNSAEDDEFVNDLETLPNGDLILAGFRGTQGVIFRANNAGTLVNGVSPGLAFAFSDVAPGSGGTFYAVGTDFQNQQAHLMKFNADLLVIWDVTIEVMTEVKQVWQATNGDIFVTGETPSPPVANQPTIYRFIENIDGPALQWSQTLDNGELAYQGGATTFLPPSQLAYVDGRIPSAGGFGQLCAFLSISDLALTTCMTVEVPDIMLPGNTIFYAPILPDIAFFDEPTASNLSGNLRTWQQGDACNPASTCTTSIVVNYVDNCGHVQVNTVNTGPLPISYQWCSGESTASLDVQLPCGPHTFCVSITCADGSMANASQTINITDNIPPTALCAPGFGVSLDANCTTIITPAMIDAGSYDNCQIQSISVSPTTITGCGDFPVILTVKDWCNNTSTCTTSVQTLEVVPPQLTCPANTQITCNGSTSPTLTGMATATDNCDPNPVINYTDANSGLIPCNGQITRIWTARDTCGNDTSCVQLITIADLAPPTIMCPPAMQLSCNDSTLPASTGTATATDNCDSTPAISFSDVSSGQIPCNAQIIRTWTATDSCGNDATCMQLITINDQQPPTITCPPNQTVSAGLSGCTAVVNGIKWLTATDNCGTPPVTYVVSGTTAATGLNDASGLTFNAGLSTVTYTATDACGNPASCSFTIMVSDNVPPNAICLPGVGIELDTNCAAVLTPGLIDGGSFDNCQIQSISVSPNTFNQCGAFPVTLTVMDNSGNMSTCASSVQVTDGIPPVAVCTGIGVVVDANCQGAVTASLLDGGSTDNCQIQSLSVSPGTLSGCGLFPVTLTVTDVCGNSSSCVAMVQTIEDTPPAIMCPPDMQVDCAFGLTPNITGYATATDNCDPNPAIAYSDMSTPGAGPCSWVLMRTWSANDACGNESTCLQVITVSDHTLPNAVCLNGVGIELDANCMATVSANQIDGGSTDNCQIQTFGVSPNAFNQCGVFPVTLSVTDWCGNTSNCFSQVQVGDPISPVITCIPGFSVVADPVTCTAVVNGIQWATLSDNCALPTVSYDITGATTASGTGDASGLTFLEGFSTLTYTATDICGNTASCSLEIEVACFPQEDICWEWAARMGSTNTDVGNSIAVDAVGNVYTTGLFRGTVDFDPGPGIFNLGSFGAEDVFITKMDISGNLLWAKQIGGSFSDYGTGAIDASGNVYIAGTFSTTTDFDPGAGTFNLTPVSGFDGFLLKLDANGNFLWVKHIVATSASWTLVPRALVVDPSGNIYVTADFNGIYDFDPGAGVFTLNSAPGSDIVTFKIDAGGNLVWAKQLQVTGSVQDIAVDASGNVLTTGEFSGVSDFDPSAATVNLSPVGSSNTFIVKLDGAGNFVWAKQIDNGTNFGLSLAVDAAGNVYTTGGFSNTADFDPGPGIFSLSSTGNYDIYILKLDAAGGLVWAKDMGGGSNDRGISIGVDALQQVYTTGFFAGTADFDPDLGVTNFTATGFYDMFITKLDAAGNLGWAKQISGITAEKGNAIAIDALGCVYTTGDFQSIVDFDAGPSVFSLTSAGIEDAFVLKMCPCIRTGVNEPGEQVKGFELLAAYPNPFRHTTTIGYYLPVSIQVRLAVYDLLGREMAVLVNEQMPQGSHTIDFELGNLPAGTYYYTMQAGDYRATRKLVCIK